MQKLSSKSKIAITTVSVLGIGVLGWWWRLSQDWHYALSHANEFVLYSLQPKGGLPLEVNPRKLQPKHNQSHETLDGNIVLGKVVIKDRATRLKLIDALEEGVDNAHGLASCFEPRHAIRVRSSIGETTLLICFTCSQMQVDSYSGSKIVPIDGAPKKTFNKILRDAHIPLAKDPSE